MALYRYTGYDAATGAKRRGKIDADTPKGAKTKLKQKHKIIVASLVEDSGRSKTTPGEGKQESLLARLTAKKVSLEDISVMTRQFATLQRAHVPLDESLRALTEQVENPTLRTTLASVKDLVSEGRSLGHALGQYPRIFSPLYVNMVRAGESSGQLGLVLDRLSDFLEYQVAVRGQIMSAISYPAIMIISSVCIIAYLFVSVVPKLQKVFANLEVDLPWYTEMLIGISEFIQNWWMFIIIAGFVGYFIFQKWVATESGRYRWDKMTLGFPVFGPILLRFSVSRFTKTLSTLLASGVPIIQALDITKNVVANAVIAKVVEESKINVQEGASLAASIIRSPHFPPLVTHMIATGERTGQLEEMLAHISEGYNAEVERKISSMIALIEPIMTIVMGGISVLVVFAMLVPMLSVMNQMR